MLLVWLAAGMVLPVGVTVFLGVRGEWPVAVGQMCAMVVAGVLILVMGLLLKNFVGRGAEYEMGEWDSIWIAVTVWLVVPMSGVLPYLIAGGMGFVDALFESFSGFTTTGSSVLAEPEALGPGLLVYRAMTQWIGGLGLLLFVVAFLRKLGVSAGGLYSAEFSGTQGRKLHPRLARSVSRMWRIYIAVTLVMVVLLLLQGVSVVDSIALAFSTVSTGGFVTGSGGVSTLGAGALMTLTVFMFLSGINVAVLYRLFAFRWREIRLDEELRTYIVLFLVSVAVCFVSFLVGGWGVQRSLGYSVFHIASTMSTCGYWLPSGGVMPLMVSALTFVLIVTGACAGSTGGGLKLRRVIVMWKYIGGYFTRMLHPGAVTRVKVDGVVVDDGYIHKVFAFVFLYIGLIVGGAFVLTLCGSGIPEAMCMAAANVSNLGPSPLLSSMGGSLDYSLLPAGGKVALVVLMLAGRLEIFALVAVFFGIEK